MGGHVSKRGRRSCHRGTCSPDLDGWPWRACNPARMRCTDTDTGCPLYRFRPAALSSTGFRIGKRRPIERSRPCTRTRDPSTVITDAVQADGVGPAGRAGAEDSRWRTVRVIAGAGDGHVAAGPVEPGRHHDLSTGPKIADPFGDLRLKHEPRRRCAQVALPWRLRPVFQW